MGGDSKNRRTHPCERKCAGALEPLAAARALEGASLVAVSGGADSVALLYLLRRLHPELSLHVVHFNHQLRGEESRRDEAFTRKLAQEMNLPFRVGSAEVAAEAAGSGKSI